MRASVIVLGGGGHARVLLDILALRSVKILGVTDLHPEKVDRVKINAPILGNDDVILNYRPDEIFLVNGLGQIKVDGKRRELFETFKGKGYKFLTLIHPSAVIAKDAEIGEGAQIMAGAVIQTGCCIGANAIINTRASVDHDCDIGAHVHLAPGVILSGEVTIGSNSHLGPGAVVIQGIRVGAECFVKAKSLVKKNLPDGTILSGVSETMVES